MQFTIILLSWVVSLKSKTKTKVALGAGEAYIQDMSDVLFLAMGTVQGHSDWLLSKAQCILAEEVHLQLVMENCGRDRYF